MDPEAACARMVFILAEVTRVLDVEAVARRAAVERRQLVLLVVGRRVSAEQKMLVERALRSAGEHHLWFDAVWVTGASRAAEYIEEGDEVTILASGRERRRLERALGSLVRPRPGPPRLRSAEEGPRRRGRRCARLPWARAAIDRKRAAGISAGGRSRMADEPGTDDQPVLDAPTLIAPQVATESVEALAGREIPQPVLETVWTEEEARARKRAALRIYLGMAPGVGKTFAMLDEGHRRKSRGTDVVVATVQTYGRPRTIEKLQGLEIVPPREITYRGRTFEEMDVEAVIARRPNVALVDELAHTNIPGSRRAKRWEDVLDLLAEGIVVITTLNIQHLESLNDVVARITGVRQQETVPDWIFDLADQVELVDMSPYALRRRMMHGNVYPDPGKAELALQKYFTMENLTALRELALMRVANLVDEDLLRRWTKDVPPETRERILVCVSRPEMADVLIRRGARMAQRARGELLVLHLVTTERDSYPPWAGRIERLVRDLGGEFQIIEAEDPVEGALSFAYRQHVTQIVVGKPLRPKWQELLRGSFVNRLLGKASDIDVHVIARRER